VFTAVSDEKEKKNSAWKAHKGKNRDVGKEKGEGNNPSKRRSTLSQKKKGNSCQTKNFRTGGRGTKKKDIGNAVSEGGETGLGYLR